MIAFLDAISMSSVVCFTVVITRKAVLSHIKIIFKIKVWEPPALRVKNIK